MVFQTFILSSFSRPDFDVEHFDWLLMIDEVFGKYYFLIRLQETYIVTVVVLKKVKSEY